jgi:hypothetical protein
MERDEQMGHRLCKRVCNMPTKQNHNPSKENAIILDHHRTRDASLQTSRDGPNHQPPKAQWERCDPNDYRSWMLMSSGLPSLCNNHHRARDCPVVHGPHLQMVQIPHEGDK